MYKKHLPKRQKMAKITKFASFDDIFLFLASLTSFSSSSSSSSLLLLLSSLLSLLLLLLLFLWLLLLLTLFLFLLPLRHGCWCPEIVVGSHHNEVVPSFVLLFLKGHEQWHERSRDLIPFTVWISHPPTFTIGPTFLPYTSPIQY